MLLLLLLDALAGGRHGGRGGGRRHRFAVLPDDGGRGDHGRGRGGRREIGLLPPVVPPNRRFRAEDHGPVVLAEAPVRVMGGEYTAERVPELGVEYRVDNRVERRVGVTEPGEHFERGLGYARVAEPLDDVDAEERYPAQQERAHYNAHRYGRLVIAHVVRRRVVVDGRQRGGRCGRRCVGRRRCGRRQWPGDRPDTLHVLLRVTVQPAVDADHHYARYVEADARRYDRVFG